MAVYTLPILDTDEDTLLELQEQCDLVNSLDQLEQDIPDLQMSMKISNVCDTRLIKLQHRVRRLQGQL